MPDDAQCCKSASRRRRSSDTSGGGCGASALGTGTRLWVDGAGRALSQGDTPVAGPCLEPPLPLPCALPLSCPLPRSRDALALGGRPRRGDLPRGIHGRCCSLGGLASVRGGGAFGAHEWLVQEVSVDCEALAATVQCSPQVGQ